jgi:hypothetical protein
LAGVDSRFLFPAVKKIYLPVVNTVEFFNTLVIEIDFRNGFAVKVDNLIGSKDDRGALLKNTVIRKSFYDKLDADAIKVAATDTDYWFYLTHILLIGSKSNDFAAVYLPIGFAVYAKNK